MTPTDYPSRKPSKKPVTRRPTKTARPVTVRPTAQKVLAVLASAAPSSAPQISISATVNVLQVTHFTALHLPAFYHFVYFSALHYRLQSYIRYLTLLVTFPLPLQSVSGLCTLQTADDAFVAALTETLVDLLGEGTAVSDVTLSHPGRRLLANQHLKYTITETNGMTTQDIIDVLQDATDSGDFFVAFSANAGVAMTGVKHLQTVDVTPTAAPTSGPKTGTNILLKRSSIASK
jgi:hypothetical protein